MLEVPPFGAGFATVTLDVPTETRLAAGTVAFSVVDEI